MSFITKPLNEISFQPQKWCTNNHAKPNHLKHQFFISCSGIHSAVLGTDWIKMLSANLACYMASSKFPFFPGITSSPSRDSGKDRVHGQSHNESYGSLNVPMMHADSAALCRLRNVFSLKLLKCKWYWWRTKTTNWVQLFNYHNELGKWKWAKDALLNTQHM